MGIGLCGVVLNCVKSVNPEYFDKSCQKRVITLQPENTNVKKNSFIMARRRKKSESETAFWVVWQSSRAGLLNSKNMKIFGS